MPDFYGTAAGFRSYHEARGTDVSAYADDTVIEAGLLVGSEFVDARYLGVVADRYLPTGGRSQVRILPVVGLADRYGYLIGDNEIPREVESATYEATLRELQSAGALFKDYTPSQYKSVSVDGAVSINYRSFNSVSETETQFSIIDAVMRPLLSGWSKPVSSLSGGSFRG